ncbi:CHASE2 domain-containing protein [Hydrogenovibrio halophilus]|uniref:CHASE2 domain-containing protein n=1 Tax=Hydrogenovibrio halophilus TaxID=373391 RepID=UPI0003660165|nr:CHASE2 domain-containing protein [Hydrogenovibrio halophilus]
MLNKTKDSLCFYWTALPFWGRLLGRSIIFVFLGVLAMEFNPLGLTETADEKSEEEVSKILSPFYPFSDERHDEKIVILLINDSALDLVSQLPEPMRITYANEWPILYKDHANVLKTIASNSDPKQIFIDIEFQKIRNTDDTFNYLTRTLKALNQKKEIKILHATGSIKEHIDDEINNQLSIYSTPVFNAWSNKNEMPLYKKFKDKYIYSPALKMYENLNTYDTTLTNFNENMFVFWSDNFNKRLYSQTLGKECEDRSSFFNNLKRSTIYFAEYLPWFQAESRYCYAQRVIYLDELQKMLNKGAVGKEKIKTIFDDATILYAADYIALGDKVYSPVHGTIPGVFYHAMALENLLDFKGNYFRSLGKVYDYSLWAIFAIALAFIMATKEKNNSSYILGELKASRKLAVILLLLAYIIFIAVLTVLYHVAPANIINAIGLIPLAWLLFKIEEDCYQKKCLKKDKE